MKLSKPVCILMTSIFLSLATLQMSQAQWEKNENVTFDFINVDRFPSIMVGPLTLGGSVRGGGFVGEERSRLYVNTFSLRMDMYSDAWGGTLGYRYVTNDGPSAGASSFHALHSANISYTTQTMGRFTGGVQRVPFGILPYTSNSWFFSLARYAGFEDDRDAGARWRWQNGPWRFDLAFFPVDEPSWGGDHGDHARLSFDPVKQGRFGVEEEYQVNMRSAYELAHGGDRTTEIGLSLQHSQLDASAPSNPKDGYALAVHIDSEYNRWHAMLQTTRYEYAGDTDKRGHQPVILVGGYDVPHGYLLARRGWFHSLGLSYDLPIDHYLIDKITLYNDVGMHVKDNNDYRTGSQYTAGINVESGRWYGYIEAVTARNHPWLAEGEDASQSALAEGSDNWTRKFLVSLGYYF